MNYNTTKTFTVTPNTGYTASVGGTCGGNLVGTTYTTNAVTADCTVVATFAINTYTVTPSAGTNGSITPNTPQSADYNTTKTFTVMPNTGYVANVGGTCGGALVGTTYTTNPITANCTVVASFALSTYTVTPSAGGNGTITPNTPQTVNYNATTTFTVTPNTGYTASVAGTCGGNLVGTTYTTNAITADCTVVASFAINTYTVTASAGANGTITPPTQTIDYGSTATFTVTPDTGYSANVTGDTCTVTHGSGNTWTTNAISADCAVTATFSLSTYDVTTTVGANGTLMLADSGVDLTAVAYGTVLHFTVTPNSGYAANVTGCGGTLSGNTYTTGAITADCAVAANFVALPVPNPQSVSVVTDKSVQIQLTASGGGVTFAILTSPSNGSITNFDPVAGTLTYTPNPGYVGTDSFTFTATNTVGTSQPATVSITVRALAAQTAVPALDVCGMLLLMLLIAATALRFNRAGRLR